MYECIDKANWIVIYLHLYINSIIIHKILFEIHISFKVLLRLLLFLMKYSSAIIYHCSLFLIVTLVDKCKDNTDLRMVLQPCLSDSDGFTQKYVEPLNDINKFFLSLSLVYFLSLSHDNKGARNYEHWISSHVLVLLYTCTLRILIYIK